MALRQTTGFVESLLHLIDLDWAVPNFSTLSLRRKTLKVNIPYRGSAGPLHLLIDSTGIKAEGEWNARKHGGTKRRVWRKIHIGIDEQTLEIRAAEFTTSDVGDAPMLPELLDQIPPSQEIASVTADGAFDTRKCHDAIAARGAAAIIPPRKNAKPWKPDTPGAVTRNEALRASRRFGRTIWRRWSGYHRRSRVETKMHCIELLGQPSGIPSDQSQECPRHGEGLRPSGRRVPCQGGRTERLHRTRHPGNSSRGMNLSGDRGGPLVTGFVQQSLKRSRAHCPAPISIIP
jgi:hypothetical protein